MEVRALVADDSCFMRTILAGLLRSVGIREVVEASDGNEAIRLFDLQTFDVVLTDWDMPGRTGLQVIEAIRSRGSRVPIVVVTGETVEDKQALALRAGASLFLTKPIRMELVRHQLCRCLQGQVA